MKLYGDWQDLEKQLSAAYPDALAAIERAARVASGSTKQCIDKEPQYLYQAIALFGLASSYNRPGARLLEIGTYYGRSASIIALAAPDTEVVTINPVEWEFEAASHNLQPIANVSPLCVASWDYLETYDGPELAMIFVDGDHKRAPMDLPWWNWVEVGGLFLWHDYSPNGSARACPPVWRALHAFAANIGRGPDVEIIDSHKVGMAGWIKRAEDNRVRI